MVPRARLAVLALLGAVGATVGRGSDAGTVATCGRGARDALAEALAGGSVELRFTDDDGDVLGEVTAPADRASRHAAAPPADAVRVEVRGLDASGAEVAHGTGVVRSSGACVCLAL